jgi:exopolysaccharide production protein ExoY
LSSAAMFSPVIRTGGASRCSLAWRALEFSERAAALLLLVALAPLLAAIAVAVALLSGQSPLVAHRRCGRYGNALRMLKFRTMWTGATVGSRHSLVELLGDNPVPERKAVPDPRVTSRFARFCRKYSLDELPQLWHICRGEMSFVGPRPVTRAELSKHYGDASAEVLDLKPGLTGLWQVLGRSRLTYPQRRRLDLFLARKFSASFYFAILLWTPARVLSGRDSW